MHSLCPVCGARTGAAPAAPTEIVADSGVPACGPRRCSGVPDRGRGTSRNRSRRHPRWCRARYWPIAFGWSPLRGRGGMGEVYRAEDLKLDQPVALKCLPEEVSSDPARLARLLQEVRIARHVSHPNVCRVYDVAEDGGPALPHDGVDRGRRPRLDAAAERAAGRGPCGGPGAPDLRRCRCCSRPGCHSP